LYTRARNTVELVQSNTWVFHHLWHSTKLYGPKLFLITKIKPEYSDILYNQTHFPGSLVCLIRQVSLCVELECCIQQILCSDCTKLGYVYKTRTEMLYDRGARFYRKQNLKYKFCSNIYIQSEHCIHCMQCSDWTILFYNQKTWLENKEL